MRQDEGLAAMNRDLESLVEAGKAFAFRDENGHIFYRHALYVTVSEAETAVPLEELRALHRAEEEAGL